MLSDPHGYRPLGQRRPVDELGPHQAGRHCRDQRHRCRSRSRATSQRVRSGTAANTWRGFPAVSPPARPRRDSLGRWCHPAALHLGHVDSRDGFAALRAITASAVLRYRHRLGRCVILYDLLQPLTRRGRARSVRDRRLQDLPELGVPYARRGPRVAVTRDLSFRPRPMHDTRVAPSRRRGSTGS